MGELKPCRKCGAPCAIEEFALGQLWVCSNGSLFGKPCTEHAYISEDEWNTRTPPASQSDEALVELLSAVFKFADQNGSDDVAHLYGVFRAYSADNLARSVLQASVAAARADEREKVLDEAATRDVLAERERQKSVEGWTPEHDDEHADGELADAAACYAYGTVIRTDMGDCLWPWGDDAWKPSDRRRELVKAGALILAEIERLDRALKGERTS